MLLSICIPTYNRPEHAMDTVKKCLQIPGDFYEVVLVDDCSDYDGYDLFNTISNPRFRYVRNDRNLGYANLGQALKEGNGEYCILLGDKDDLFVDNWEDIVRMLIYNTDTSIFHWKYYSFDGSTIRDVTIKSQQKLLRARFEALLFTKYHFAEAAGLMFRKRDIDKVWDAIDKESLLWNLYPQEVLALLLSTCGDCEYVGSIKTVLKRQDRKIHISQTYGGGSEPYWVIPSRKKQNKQWLDIIYGLDIDNQTKKHLAHTVCVNAIKQVGDYYEIIHDEFKMSKLFYKTYELEANEDRKKNNKEWRKVINDVENNLLSLIKEQWGHHYYYLDFEYAYRRNQMKRRVYKKMNEIKTNNVGNAK